MTELVEKYYVPGERWPDLCDRVSGIMQYENEREAIREILLRKDFLANSPTLVSAGREGGRNLAACNIIHVENSIEGIMDAAKWCAILFKSGAGVGLELSKLSPYGTPLKYVTGGIATGPVSFMPIFDAVGHAVREGGLRRAAILALLSGCHPDALQFIRCKNDDGQFENFNISVSLNAGPDSVPREVWDAITEQATKNGEPGVVFLDRINEANPTRDIFGDIECVNACSEYPGYNFSPCVLGSLNLLNVITDLGDYDRLEYVARWAVRFLDRVVDVNPYPLSQIAQVARQMRDLGLGVMGWEDLLKREGIPFVSPAALELAHEIAQKVKEVAHNESRKLAKERGPYHKGKYRRNRVVTTIAPTGSIALLAGVSKSIYPDYPTQLSMKAEDHLDLLEAWMTGVDSGISYTVCFPHDKPKSFVDRILRQAYERGVVKTLAVYRDGSREGQPEHCMIGEGRC